MNTSNEVPQKKSSGRKRKPKNVKLQQWIMQHLQKNLHLQEK